MWAEYNEIHRECKQYETCVALIGLRGHEIIDLINRMIDLAQKKA
jgi:flagellar biosynthesis/type III secretory pathway ATPase